jgi:2,3-bisphosphoglycerate-independent phosphoglycerate mutase
VRHLLLWFVDGLGIGQCADPDNPLLVAQVPTLRSLLGGPLCAASFPTRNGWCSAVALDATLGVPGRPQSGTGQVALLTGHNAAAAEGRHVPGFPTKRLRAVLGKHSLFARLRRRGVSVALANAYPEPFLRDPRARHGAFLEAARAAGVAVRDLVALGRGEAVAGDLTGEGLVLRGYPVQAVAPEEAGRRLVRLASRYGLTVFEFFALDLASHGRSPRPVAVVLEQLDRALGAALDGLDPRTTTLVLTSDHGGAEAPGGAHTANPVPLVAVGDARDAVVAGCHSLVDVAPALEAALTGA